MTGGSGRADVLAEMRRAMAILNDLPDPLAPATGEPSKLVLLSAADARPARGPAAHLYGIPLPATVEVGGVARRIEVSPLVPAGQAYVIDLDAIRDAETSALQHRWFA